MYKLDGVTLEQYPGFSRAQETEFLHDDECCVQACSDMDTYASMLDACANRDESSEPATYEIVDDDCTESQVVTIEYSASVEGLVDQCSITQTITKSSSFEIDNIQLEQCCSLAVDGELDDEGLDRYCFEETVPSDDTNMRYNAVTEVCTMVDGEEIKQWKDIEGTVLKKADPVPRSDETVEQHLCCLAFTDEPGHVNFDYELYFACQELTDSEVDYSYDKETDVCTVEGFSYTYTDLNVDEKWTQEADGDYYNREDILTTDDNDPCCNNANGDLDLLEACVKDVLEDDEWFMYDPDTHACTRHYDRTTTYTNSEGV